RYRQGAANRVECGAPRQRVGAAAERGAPSVAARHDRIKKEALLIGNGLAHGEICLQRVVVIKGVRTLHDADTRVGKEANGAHDEIALRHEVGIKDSDEFATGIGKSVVDVARLGMKVVGPRDIAGTLVLAESLQPWPAAVVEHPHAKIRIIEAEGPDNS